MPATPRPIAMHIGAFGPAFELVDEKLRQLLSTERYRVNGQAIELSRVDRSHHVFLPEVIRRTIRTSCLVIADLTPIASGLPLQLNANLMDEHALAEAWGVPTFRICDKQFRSVANQLPFNIRTCPIHWFDPNEPDLVELLDQFQLWYSPSEIHACLAAKMVAADATAIEAIIRSWPAHLGAPFIEMVAHQMQTTLATAATIAQYLDSDGTQEVTFTERPETLDTLLAGVVRSLRPRGRYMSFSNPTFLKLLVQQRSRFQEELLEAAAKRKIVVKRLIMIGRDEIADPDVLDVLAVHDNWSRSLPNYQVRYDRSEEAVGHSDRRHSGIFIWPDGRLARFRPVYETRQGTLVLSKVEYSNSALAAHAAFKQAWDNARRNKRALDLIGTRSSARCHSYG